MEEKYILCIPKGCGFNDTMCQIYVAYKFSLETNRTLIIDTRLSGLADLLTNYLELIDPSNKIKLGLSDKKIKQLNKLSCYPFEFTGKIDWIFHQFLATQYNHRKQFDHSAKTKEPIFLIRIRSMLNLLKYIFSKSKHLTLSNKILFFFNYCVAKNFNANIVLEDLKHSNADIIIHHMSGGGEESIEAMKLFKLNSNIHKQVLEKLKNLGDDYDAIHIRNTDYTTDYKSFLESIRQKLAGKKVLLCTDNYSVVEYARIVLKESEVFSFKDHSNVKKEENEYYPLHYQWHLPANEIYENNIVLLTDLIGLSRSTSLYYTGINNNLHKTTVSGFSKLADNLKKEKNILERWMGLY